MVGLAGSVGRAAEPDLQKAEQAVAEKLKELKVEGSQPAHLKDEVLSRALPGQAVFVLRFPLYPVARVPPAPMKAQNLFGAGADGKAKLINDGKALEELFRTSAAPVKDEKTAKDVGLAWLRLTEELNQDGFYKFNTIDEATKVSDEKGGKKVTVKAVVMEGGNGEITATLTFDEAGKLTKAEDMVQLKPGPRPKCHATKLLDADPVVRAIVEHTC